MVGPRTDNSGRIQKTESNGAAGNTQIVKPGKTLEDMLNSMKGEIARAMPKHLNPDRMARVVTTALRIVPDLAACSPASFLGCVIQCAQLGLEPNTPMGHAYLIPRNSRERGKECTLIVGYQGYIDIAARAGVTVYAYAVHQGDRFSYRLGLDPDVVHEPSEDADREDKPLTHVYAVCKLKDGRRQFVVLSRAQIEARRKRSAAAMSKFSPWSTDYEAMALKTAVRALWKWMPKSVEYVHAEGVETAADLGKSQLPAMSAEVGEMLLSSGVASRADVEAVAEPVNPQTGEVYDDEPPPGALSTDPKPENDA